MNASFVVICRIDNYCLFFSVLDIIMAKRIADTYLTDRNFDNDDSDATEEVCIKFMILY